MNTAATEDPLIGKTLSGRFRILEPLGSGGMGKVYKAMQSPLDRIVALKVLNPEYANDKDPGFERRFFLEAAMTAKLHHPNTITVHDYGRTDDGMLYIAMEYVEGETLQAMLAKTKTIGWARALNIGGQICRSLREAHKLGIIHRDLKPANVMVLHEETGSDLVKVLDFGLVKAFAGEALPKLSPELTQAGVLLGSPLYMAPETAKGEADPRADIYSLGVLLFQIITGKPPFTGKDSIDIIVKHIRERAPRLKSLKPDVPDSVDLLIATCLEKEPGDRYQTMDEVLDAMKSIVSDTGQSGAFSDPRPNITLPRSASSASIRRVSATGSHRRPNPSIEVPIETAELQTPRRLPLPWLIAGAVVLAGAIVFGVGLWGSKPKPMPMPVPPVALAPAVPLPRQEPAHASVDSPIAPKSPALVTLSISSTPPGATVSIEGQPLGVTPLTYPLKADDDGTAAAQLTFALDGYQSVTVGAEGKGTIEVTQILKKRAGKKKPSKDDHPPGYKDDPYQ